MFYALITHFVACVDLLTLGSKTALDKDLEILALRYPLRLLQRHQQPRPRCTRFEKLLLAILAVKLKSLLERGRHRLDQCLLLFKPDTVLKWHRELVRRKWTFRPTRKRGRPKTLPERESLVLRLARENVHGGTDRIHGERLKLGLRIGATTIGAILHRHGVLPAPQRGANGGSWSKLLQHYKDQILVCDFFTVEPALLQTL